jgi:hypothetical protein
MNLSWISGLKKITNESGVVIYCNEDMLQRGFYIRVTALYSELPDNFETIIEVINYFTNDQEDLTSATGYIMHWGEPLSNFAIYSMIKNIYEFYENNYVHYFKEFLADLSYSYSENEESEDILARIEDDLEWIELAFTTEGKTLDE